MVRYVVRRLLQMIPVFVGATLLIFLMVNVLGDPVAGLCGDKTCDPATAARLQQEFGLDQPVLRQYLTYMGHVLTGDFGTAFNGEKVIDLMGTAFPVTIRLTVVAIVLEIVLGLGLGVLTGLRRGRLLDSAVLLFTL
ncbi:ABC transporter permease, partial [Streptomyces tendae]